MLPAQTAGTQPDRTGEPAAEGAPEPRPLDQHWYWYCILFTVLAADQGSTPWFYSSDSTSGAAGRAARGDRSHWSDSLSPDGTGRDDQAPVTPGTGTGGRS